jgi:hypothetical protein
LRRLFLLLIAKLLLLLILIVILIRRWYHSFRLAVVGVKRVDRLEYRGT